MIVTYLDHSGFAVELEPCVLLFDYHQGELPLWEKEKAIYVFVSHKHRDHFNMKIFDLADRYPKVHYFLGSDIKLSKKYLERNHVPASVKEKITNVGKNKSLCWDEFGIGALEIQSLRSTDAGIAFIVQTQGRCIYHAGDLNWWHWEGEPYPFNENMEQNYKREIGSIEGMHFDAAFVPLDPRLEKAYGWGMDYFLTHTKADYVFPMHMWGEYDFIEKYKRTSLGSQNRERIVEIQNPGQKFELWNISYLR